jgi:hypothetical protein
MKKLVPILIISFLFQSCFSYKSVNFNDIKNEKKQKFEVSKLDKTKIKGRLISIDENTMILENKGQNQTILKDEIYDLKVRKFSALKTMSIGGLYYIFPAVGLSILLLTS